MILIGPKAELIDHEFEGLPMYAFNLHRFAKLTQFLGELERSARQNPSPSQRDLIGVVSLLEEAEECGALELQLSMRLVKRIRQTLQSPGYHSLDFAASIGELRSRIFDEVDSKLFTFIPSHKARFLIDQNLFGEEVYSHFPSANLDIEEAGKCYGAGRNTACVFHLMRVLEVGLRAMNRTLYDPIHELKTNPNWGNVLSRFDKELQKPIPQREGDWGRDDQFYSEATAHLRAVKNAWRNPTMHVESNYDEEKALEIFNAVKAFMRPLATKLSE